MIWEGLECDGPCKKSIRGVRFKNGKLDRCRKCFNKLPQWRKNQYEEWSDDAGLFCLGTMRDWSLVEFEEHVKKNSACTFWFVCAEYLREQGSEDRMAALQENLRLRRDWMVQKTITLEDSLCGIYVSDYLFISHRWEKPGEPDPNAVQLATVQDHLRQNPQVQFVWFDHWCMPQKLEGHTERTVEDQRQFDLMLPNIPLLCLGCSVLIILDLQYIGRVRPAYAEPTPSAAR